MCNNVVKRYGGIAYIMLSCLESPGWNIPCMYIANRIHKNSHAGLLGERYDICYNMEFIG